MCCGPAMSLLCRCHCRSVALVSEIVLLFHCFIPLTCPALTSHLSVLALVNALCKKVKKSDKLARYLHEAQRQPEDGQPDRRVRKLRRGVKTRWWSDLGELCLLVALTDAVGSCGATRLQSTLCVSDAVCRCV